MATYQDYERSRQALLNAADSIQLIWDEFLASRTPVADEAGMYLEDPVRTELDEALARLNQALIEVGVFGDINRGKSTLLNALLGVEVSSMEVTPETAVPVYVEGGERSARVLYADGGTESVSPSDALEMATQRYLERTSGSKKDKKKPAVVRVVQRVKADLLRQGVRLIDTPGLSDPSMSEVFEELTLSELDRAAAAIIVLLYPPGIARNEVELLQSLDLRRTDKTFIVCNFYSGPWESVEVRSTVEQGIRNAIGRGVTGSENAPIRLYSVNAGVAWQARRTGDMDSYEASGVAELARDLENYLTDGALGVLSSSAGDHLRNARNIVRSRVEDRLSLLSDARRLAEVKARKMSVVEDARRRAEDICQGLERQGEHLGSRLSELAKEPFEQALAELSESRTREDIDMLAARWKVRVETMISRVGNAFTSGLAELSEAAQEELIRAFHVDRPDIELVGRDAAALEAVASSRIVATDLLASDWGKLALAAGAGAVGGGALAGGAGMALLWFMGPVGWAVGAGIGALLGAGAAGLWDRSVPANVRRDVTSRIEGGMLEAQRRAREQAHAAAATVADRVRQLERGFSADAVAELEAVERFLKDPDEMKRQHVAAERLVKQLIDVSI